jgi:hypothetical protein
MEREGVGEQRGGGAGGKRGLAEADRGCGGEWSKLIRREANKEIVS